MYVRGDGDNALNDWLPSYNGAAGYFGAGYPTATWAAVMKRDLVGLPEDTFPPPANVTGDPPETGHAPYTPPPPPPTTRHTRSSAPTSSAPTSEPTSSAPPPSSPTTSHGPPSCVPNVTCPSDPTTSSSPGGGGSGDPNPKNPSASIRPLLMSSREPWW
jgi:hypothetical protein